MHSVLHWNYRNLVEFPPEIPPEAGDLYLKGNAIEKLPVDPTPLLHLSELYLSENRIEELPPSLCCLTNLRRLDLSGNKLKTLPDDLYKLQNLTALMLNDNELAQLPLSVQNMSNLRELNVDDNALLWLPHKIGRNFYSTQVSFWRNKTLHQIPFTIWLHLLKDAKIPPGENLCCADRELTHAKRIRNAFELRNPLAKTVVVAPPQLQTIESSANASAPTLYELCLREICKRSSDYRIEDLPAYLIRNILNGPTAYCDLPKCKRPLFRHATMAISMGSAGRNESRKVFISSFFCSSGCWKLWSSIFQLESIDWYPAN